MENSPKQVESTNEEGSAKKAEEETEKNEEKLGRATGWETEEETTDGEWGGPYCLWAEHREDMVKDQVSGFKCAPGE